MLEIQYLIENRMVFLENQNIDWNICGVIFYCHIFCGVIEQIFISKIRFDKQK